MRPVLLAMACFFISGPVWADTISPLTITGGTVILSSDLGIGVVILGTDPQGNKFEFPAQDQDAFSSVASRDFMPGTTIPFSQIVQIDACCGGFKENGKVIDLSTGRINGTLTGALIVAPRNSQDPHGVGLCRI